MISLLQWALHTVAITYDKVSLLEAKDSPGGYRFHQSPLLLSPQEFPVSSVDGQTTSHIG